MLRFVTGLPRVFKPPLMPFYPGPGLPLTPGPPNTPSRPNGPVTPGDPAPRDPRPPAPLLPLPFPDLEGVKRFVDRLFRRFGQLWGPRNNRPQRRDVRLIYTWYRIRGPGFVTGWSSTANGYPVARSNSFALEPTGDSPWPGSLVYKVKQGTQVAGQIATFGVKDTRPGVIPPFDLIQAFNRSLIGGETLEIGPYSYEFTNDRNLTTPAETWNGASNPFPGAPNNANPDEGIRPEGPGLTPQTTPAPLQVPPRVPLIAPAQPQPKKPAPVPQPVPLVPVVSPSEALKRIQQTTGQELYRPNRLPAPLPAPATATRRLTNTGLIPDLSPTPITTTPQDARQYGTETVTSGSPRIDIQAVAEELGRVERKLGIMLQGAGATPAWLGGLTNQLISALVDALVDALIVDVPGTSYEFTAPCDKDAEGNPVEWTAEIAAADYQPAIVARLDAIADALGVLKGWKQPNCRTSPPRSNVTVTAYEIGLGE